MNLYDLKDKRIGDELIETMFHNKRVRIQRIVSQGETTGWYDQDEDEWVALLDGEAKIEFDSGRNAPDVVTLTRGDSLYLKARCKHRVIYTSMRPPAVWLCVFFEA